MAPIELKPVIATPKQMTAKIAAMITLSFAVMRTVAPDSISSSASLIILRAVRGVAPLAAHERLPRPTEPNMSQPNPRWKQRPPGSNWGDFGPADQRGRMNLLTREKVLQGIAEVHTGETFCLSLPLDYPGKSLLNPNRHPPVLRPTLRGGAVNFNFALGRIRPGCNDVVCDDLAVLHLQYSTQWDSFAHVGSHFDADGDGLPEPVYYNGFRAGQEVIGPQDPSDAAASVTVPASTSAARALGIENLARGCVQGRGVLVDLDRHHGDARTLVGYD